MDAQGGMEAQSVHGHDDGGLTGQGRVETHGSYFDIGLFRSILTMEILRDKFMQLQCKMPTKHHLVTAVCQGGTPSQGHLH